jgi:hypothetical protein
MRSSTPGKALLVGGMALGLSLVGVSAASAASACDINCTIDQAASPNFGDNAVPYDTITFEDPRAGDGNSFND